MYIPRLRKIDAVLKEMKQADPDTVVSRFFITKLLREGKITPLKYGDAWVVNIDELYGYLTGKIFQDKPTLHRLNATYKRAARYGECSERKISTRLSVS